MSRLQLTLHIESGASPATFPPHNVEAKYNNSSIDQKTTTTMFYTHKRDNCWKRKTVKFCPHLRLGQQQKCPVTRKDLAILLAADEISKLPTTPISSPPTFLTPTSNYSFYIDTTIASSKSDRIHPISPANNITPTSATCNIVNECKTNSTTRATDHSSNLIRSTKKR